MKPILVLNKFFSRSGLPSIAVLAACSLTILAPTAEAISLLSNGSFESPSAFPNAYSFVFPTDWSASFGGVVNGDPGKDFPVAHGGSQYSLNGTGGNWIQQTFTVGMGGNYELTWFDNTLINNTLTRYSVTVYDSANVAIASASSGIFTGAETWNARSLSMTLAEGGAYRLYFANDATATGYYYALDDVSLDAVTSSSVPDTGSTAGLLSLAFLGMTLLARKQRNKFAE